MSTLTQRILIILLLALIFGNMNLAKAEPPDAAKRRYCCASHGDGFVSAEYLKGKTACLGELAKPLMEADKFSGDLNCEGSHLKIIKVGDIFVKGKKFSIYDYRYVTIPEPGLQPHGGERIIIIEDDKAYVGQYFLASVPYCNMHIRGTSVYLDVPKKLGNRISFESGSPPDKAYLYGYVEGLGKH